jgi:hypothetical protein
MPQTSTTQVEVPVPGEAPPAAPEPSPAPPAPSSPAPSAPAGEPAEGGAQASEAPHSHDAGLQLAERRPPRGVECYLNLAEITAQFDTAKTAVKDATAATREKLSAELVKRAAAAQAKGKLADFAASAPPMLDKLTAEISAVLSDFYAAGRTQVADELQRQKAGKPWTSKTIRAAELALAEGSTPEELGALKQQAAAMARAIAASIQAAAAMQAARIAAGTPLVPDVMEAMVAREGDAAALRFAAAASDFMSMGRSAEADAQATDIEDAVYSALLDGATCAACEPMDGETTTDLTLAESWAPNPDCEGGEKCRCLVVYEIRQEPAGPTLAESVVKLSEAVVKQSERPITAHVTLSAPTTPAPVVNVAAPVVNVAAAEAPIVNVTVPGPRRVKRETQFITDESGRIVGKTETEE